MDVAARAMHGRAAAGANVAAHLAGSPMSTYALGSVFSPTSVAVVGASPRERSLGRLVLRQLREGGFAGPVGLVNPNYRERSEEHTSELQSLMRISYAVFCLK